MLIDSYISKMPCMLIVVCMFKVYKVIETTRKNDIFQNLDFLLMILIDGYKSKMPPSLH